MPPARADSTGQGDGEDAMPSPFSLPLGESLLEVEDVETAGHVACVDAPLYYLADQLPAPYQPVMSWRWPSLETPSRPGSIAPGLAVPLPPRRNTCAVPRRSRRGSPGSSKSSGSWASMGLGLTWI